MGVRLRWLPSAQECWSAWGLSGSAVVVELSVQGGSADLEDLRGGREVAFTVPYDAADVLFLCLRKAHHGLLFPHGRGEGCFDVGPRDILARCELHGSFDAIAQFAHVARPGLLGQRSEGLRENPPEGAVRVLLGQLEEMLGEQRDVVSCFSWNGSR